MKKNRNLGLLLITLSLVLAMLACSFGGAAPTEAPAPPTAVEATEAPTVVKATEVPTEAPTEEPTEAPTEEPTEEPAEEPAAANAITIDAIRGYRDNFGSLRIVGLLTNNTNRAVDSIEIEIEILDADENVLLAETTYASLYTLAPGETSPFSYSVWDELPDADSFVATIVGQSTSSVERADVSIEDVILTTDDSGDLHLTGNLVNNTDAPIQINSLAAATFGEAGELYTADSHAVLIRHLDPGEDGPFRVTMTSPKDNSAAINEYKIYVDAETADPATVYDLVFSESHYSYMDAYNSFHLVGQITNNSADHLTLSLVGGIYDADGNVLDAATTDIPTFSIAHGETLPYDFQYWGPLNYKADAIDSADSYTVQWDPYWTWNSTIRFTDITTQNDTYETSSYQITFKGQVLNNSGSAVDGATVIISLFDKATGELIATSYGGVYEEIAANATADYTVWTDIPKDFNIDTVEYVIIAKGELP